VLRDNHEGERATADAEPIASGTPLAADRDGVVPRPGTRRQRRERIGATGSCVMPLSGRLPIIEPSVAQLVPSKKRARGYCPCSTIVSDAARAITQ